MPDFPWEKFVGWDGAQTERKAKQIGDPTIVEGDKVDLGMCEAEIMSEENLHKQAVADGLTIITLRCEDGPSIVPGAIKGRCGACAKDVWLSPATVASAPIDVAPIRCMQCITEQLERENGHP